jgi:UDP-glucose 4-epimerase
MRGQRVLVSGMGGELGSLVATMLETEDWVGSLLGIDVDPPRRRLHRSDFHLIQPTNRERIVDTVTRFDPHVLVHLAVWEPDARASTEHARQFTHDATTAILGAAAECKSLEHVVTRSGIEIYGRARNSPTRPDERSALDPTSTYGRMLADLEKTARSVANRVGVPVTKLRLAPVLGRHVPSPLGRLLRQPAVPFSLLADAPFTVIDDHDAARAFVAAARNRFDGPINVVAPGGITTLQALLRGRRVPLPLVGPEWRIAGRLSHAIGAPIPDHVLEVMHRGRLAADGRAAEALGVSPHSDVASVIDRLYSWPTIVRRPAREALAS